MNQCEFNQCGLKRIIVCINNRFQQISVENVVETLKEMYQGTPVMICQWTDLEHEKAEVGDLIIGDTQADVGLGEYYRGDAPFVLYHIEDATPAYLQLVYARKYGLPLVIAETERLLIREMTMEDLDDLYELYGSLKDCPYVEPLYQRPEEEAFAESYIKNMYGFFQYGLWLVFLKESGKLVARIGIENREIDGETKQELGYLVDSRFQHQHIAMEACSAVIEYAAHTLYLKELYACIHTTNEPSKQLAQKLDFVQVTGEIEGMYLYVRPLSSS